jgi:uncharacterized membrane protein YphA (DoxX/SURF4 family)
MKYLLREPAPAALFAAAVTILYIHIRSKMNDQKLENYMYVKPALLVGLLVYFIIHYGNSYDEPILKTSMV